RAAGEGAYPPLGGAGFVPRGEDGGRGSGRDGTARRRLAARPRREPLDRLGRSRRAGRADPVLRRSRFPPPRLSRPRPRPGALPEALRRAGPAPPAQGVRLSQGTVVALVPTSRRTRRPRTSVSCPLASSWTACPLNCPSSAS